MSEYEEGHIHFTISEFASLCEELGFHHILPLLMKQIRVYKALPDNLDDCVEVFQALDKLSIPVQYCYQALVNDALAEAEENQDDVFITDEEAPDEQQVH